MTNNRNTKPAPLISAGSFQKLHKCWGWILICTGLGMFFLDVVGFILRDKLLILGTGIIISIVCLITGSLACHVGIKPSRCTLCSSSLINLLGFFVLCAIIYLSFIELIERQKELDSKYSKTRQLLYYRCIINVVCSVSGAVFLLGHCFLSCFNCSTCSHSSGSKSSSRSLDDDEAEPYLLTTSYNQHNDYSDQRPNLATAPPLELLEIESRGSYNYESAPPTYDSCFRDGQNQYTSS